MSNGVAVVTGASSGIGAATARRLVAEGVDVGGAAPPTARPLGAGGFDVVAAARRLDRLQQLSDEAGCTPFALDVTDPASVRALAVAVPTSRGRADTRGGTFGPE